MRFVINKVAHASPGRFIIQDFVVLELLEGQE